MRTQRAIRNILASLTATLLVIVCGMLLQRVLVQQLGLEYAGLTSLFTNIVSMLAVAEMGIGVAVISQLYHPLAHRDVAHVRALLGYYKKAYRLIAAVILGLGVLCIPFLPLIVGKTSVHESLSVIFFLFVAEAIASYLLAYKRSLFYADQKSYVITLIHAGCFVLTSLMSMAILVLTKSFLLYLVLRVIARVVESYILNRVVSYRYPELSRVGNETLDSRVRRKILQNIRGMFFHKLAAFVVLNTDVVVISFFLGISVVGLYSNYLLVITALTTLVMSLFGALTASVGNLLVEGKPEKSYEVYKRIRLANFWVASVVAIGFGVSVNSFVSLWLGPHYTLTWPVVLVLAINLYLSLYRSAISVFKEAAGIFHQDKVVPLMELLANLIFSLLFVHYFGLVGVFVGTLLSSLVVHLYGYPRYVYGPLFQRNTAQYFKEFFYFTSLACLAAVVSCGIVACMSFENRAAMLVVKLIGAMSVTILLYWVAFRHHKEYRYLVDIKNMLLLNRR